MRPPHSQTPGLYKLASSKVRDTLHAICKAVSEAWQRKIGSLQEPTLVDNGHLQACFQAEDSPRC